jgi:hypothetical protein
MNAWLEARDMGFVIMWAIVGLTFVAWIIYEIRDTAFQNGYWKGRADGWNMHRRMTNIKTQSDEVFDYDKQN